MSSPAIRLGSAAMMLACSPLAQRTLLAQRAPASAARPEHTVAASDATTINITAGAKYRAGAMHRWLMGDLYRDLWTSAIRVPLLDLDTYAGGIKPLKAGGGMQTKSLRFVTKDGIEYVFRCIQKEDAWTVPEALKGTIVMAMSRDQVSANHPGGALMVSTLLEAVGALHAPPLLVVMPRDADLGEFTKDFAGQLGWIEAFPHKPDSGDGFAGKSAIIDTDDLLKKLNADPDERVDAGAYLSARLVDMLVGDWDRHHGQWKWAKIEQGSGSAWVAIPRDHDMAFVTYEGLIGRVGGMFYPFYKRFTGSSATASGLTWDSLEMDRRLLGTLDKAAWDSVVTDVSRRLTDSVIDAAVAGLPAEYQVGEPPMASVLKERRSRLPALANDVYALFFNVADIHATDESDQATVTHVNGGFVDVRIESAKGTPMFVRRFDARETREIRIYLHGGDDAAVIRGDVSRSIPVRIIGGNGSNTFADSATVGGRRRTTRLYDIGTVTGVKYGKDTLFNRRHWENVGGKPAPPPRDRGTTITPSIGISAPRGMGVMPRIGVARTVFGFERRPYASRMELGAEYAMLVRGSRFVALADKRLEGSPVHFTAFGRLSWLELNNYHGLGNATPDSGNTDYFAVRQRQFTLRPAIAIALGERSDFSLGPVVQFSATSGTAGRFLALDRPYGSGSFAQAGVQVAMHHNVVSHDTAARHRVTVDATAAGYPALWDVKRAYQAVTLGVAGQVGLPLPTRPTFAFRAGGKHLFGEFPFHDAAFLGANRTLRYMEPQRYAGDASVYGTSELRVPVGFLSALTPFDMGLVGVAEAGRVYVSGESPGGWHIVTGGGLWVGLRGNHMKVLTLTMVTERGHQGLRLRTGLGF